MLHQHIAYNSVFNVFIKLVERKEEDRKEEEQREEEKVDYFSKKII